MIAKIIKNLEIKRLYCSFIIDDWSDSTLDGQRDDKDNPQMPGRSELDTWRITIDAEKGEILEWPKGHTAQIRYWVKDGCVILCATEGDESFSYEGRVPPILDTYGEGYGDYVIFDIDQDGRIEDWGKFHSVMDFTDRED